MMSNKIKGWIKREKLSHEIESVVLSLGTRGPGFMASPEGLRCRINEMVGTTGF